jgi:hypothetical protein
MKSIAITRRSVLVDALAGVGAISLLSNTGLAYADAAAAAQPDPLHDFDLFVGSWRAQHRRLKARLAGSTEWVEFGGTQEFRPLLGGSGNMDDNVFNLPGGAYRGVSIRAYDAKTKTWAIWWLDGRNPHTIDVPVVGSFVNGVGTFLADDTFEGKPIKVRFLWSGITRNSREWEQAFSPDGGKSWETNWVTSFTRTA